MRLTFGLTIFLLSAASIFLIATILEANANLAAGTPFSTSANLSVNPMIHGQNGKTVDGKGISRQENH